MSCEGQNQSSGRKFLGDVLQNNNCIIGDALSQVVVSQLNEQKVAAQKEAADLAAKLAECVVLEDNVSEGDAQAETKIELDNFSSPLHKARRDGRDSADGASPEDDMEWTLAARHAAIELPVAEEEDALYFDQPVESVPPAPVRACWLPRSCLRVRNVATPRPCPPCLTACVFASCARCLAVNAVILSSTACFTYHRLLTPGG